MYVCIQYIYKMTYKLLTPKENIICNIIFETIKKTSYAIYFNPFFYFFLESTLKFRDTR